MSRIRKSPTPPLNKVAEVVACLMGRRTFIPFVYKEQPISGLNRTHDSSCLFLARSQHLVAAEISLDEKRLEYLHTHVSAVCNAMTSVISR